MKDFQSERETTRILPSSLVVWALWQITAWVIWCSFVYNLFFNTPYHVWSSQWSSERSRKKFTEAK